MNKQVALIAILIGTLSVAGGCKQEPAKEQPQAQAAGRTAAPAAVPNDQVKEELPRYSNAVGEIMKPLTVIDRLTEELAQAKTAKEYVGKLRKEFVPLVTRAVTQLEALQPVTKDVQTIHAAYLASLRDYCAGLKEMADAVEKNDDNLVKTAAEKINAFKPAAAKYARESLELAQINNIKIQ